MIEKPAYELAVMAGTSVCCQHDHELSACVNKNDVISPLSRIMGYVC
jgi:hypothetical protein